MNTPNPAKSPAPVPKHRKWAEAYGTPWEVTFPARGAVKRKRRFFATEEAALAEIQLWLKGARPEAGLGKRLIDEVQYLRALLPKDVTLTDCVRHYLDHHRGIKSETLGTVCDAYVLQLDVDHRSRTYKATQTRMVDIVKKALGTETLFSTLSKAPLVKFIYGEKGSGYWDRYARRRIISCLISKAAELEAISTHPLEGWELKRTDDLDDIHILTIEDAEIVLNYVRNERADLLASFVLQLFAGVRTEELCRPVEGKRRPLDWSDIRFGVHVEVKAVSAKTRSRRVIDFWPDALTHWLTAVKQDVGPVCPVAELDTVKSRLIARLRKQRAEAELPPVDFKQNDFRRTYASAVCAYFDNPGRAQSLLGQRDKDVFFDHYREYMTKEAAVRYFASRPTPRLLLPAPKPPQASAA